jgi:hypothetical protein
MASHFCMCLLPFKKKSKNFVIFLCLVFAQQVEYLEQVNEDLKSQALSGQVTLNTLDGPEAHKKLEAALFLPDLVK